MSNVLIRAEGLKKYFPIEKGMLRRLFSRKASIVHAVDGVSFDIRKGETFTVVGETACGKTTLGRLILRLIEPTEGRIFYKGCDLLELNKKELRKIRCNMQMIFQDPTSSLNPRMTIEKIVGLPLKIHAKAKGDENKQKIIETLEKVGLSPANQLLHKYPHELSGGQRQRAGIARALITNPELIVADEPVSALDVSIRSQVLNLLGDLKEEYNLTYILITHDLSVVRYMSDYIVVMYLGKFMELARSEDLFNSPKHPYTEVLLSAIPIPNPLLKRQRIKLRGEMPSPIQLPRGCRFNTRCPCAKAECFKVEPELIEIADEHFVACSVRA